MEIRFRLYLLISEKQLKMSKLTAYGNIISTDSTSFSVCRLALVLVTGSFANVVDG